MSYDEVDDEAATRVASPLVDDFTETRQENMVDDQTMTHVAHRQPGVPEPVPPTRQDGATPGQNVLPTLPMPVVAEQRPVPAPRPAAGAPVPDVLPPTQSYGPDPRGPVSQVPLGSFPMAPGVAPQFPPQHSQQPPPQPYYVPPEHGPSGGYPPNYLPPADDGDVHGLKALLALIVFLAVALAIVVILLFIRR
jgi:hypothetical protein